MRDFDPYSMVHNQFENEWANRSMYAQWGWEIFDQWKHEVMFVADNDLHDPYVIQREVGCTISRPHGIMGTISVALPRNWSFAPKRRTFHV